MKILHVISGMDPRLGGPTKAMIGLVTAQKRAGLDVTLLTTFTRDMSDMRLLDHLRRLGIDAVGIGPIRQPLGHHSLLGPTTRHLVSRADVVHIHALWEQVQHAAAVAARRLGKPYVIRPCGMLDPWAMARRRLLKKMLLLWRVHRDIDHASLLHFVAESEMHKAAETIPLRVPALVEPNGVDLDEFSNPRRGLFRQRHPEVGSRPLVLFLSRIHQKKGLDILIPAFVKMENPDAVLVLAGPDEQGYAAEVRAMIQAHNLADRVHLVGMLEGEEKIAALADADLFVLPSYQENFGNSVIEALAAGTPVIISDQVALHDMVTAEGVGGVVPVAVEPLADELNRWLRDTALRRTTAERCGLVARRKYGWPAITERWIGHYQKLVLAVGS